MSSQRRMPYRVCLVVDHPSRDLDGLTLLAAELANRGIEAFLVPMYEAQEAFSLAPDLVLVNYVRYANARFVRACEELGIAVGVLDTEGGVRQDLDTYAAQVAPFVKPIRLYCVWGRAQYEALHSGAGLRPGALRATGCPRYDWAVPPWRGAIARPSTVNEPMLLVNTNFPLLRPRFQSREREIEDLVTRLGYPRDLVLQGVTQTEHARQQIIEATVALAREFPSATVILRPHPFEDRETYDNALRGLPNARVEQTGPVFEWIRYARLMVHFNCSTAIDALLLGVEAAHLEWIDAPLLSQPQAAAVSRRVMSIDDLKRLAARVIDGDSIPVPPELAEARRRVIHDYFFADDGRSASRVADAIEDVLAETADRPGPGLGYVARVLRAQGSMRAAAKYGVTAVGGAGIIDGMRRGLGRGERADAKSFTPDAVNAIVGRLRNVAPAYSHLAVETARPPHATMPHLTGMRSIRVARRMDQQRAAG